MKNQRLALVVLGAIGLAPAIARAASAAESFALHDGDRVVFYGDSITQQGGYGRLVEEYVATRFPAWDVRFENAGVGGDTVKGGWAGPIDVRLQRDVVAFEPTVVAIMLGMNDGGYKPFDPVTLASFGEGYRRILATLRQALPGVRLILLRSSPFDDVTRPPQFAPGYDDALRRLGCYVSALGGPDATVIDFREPVNAGLAAVLKSDPELARMLLPDRVHPSAAGHLLLGAILLRAWHAPALVTRVELDAAAAKVLVAENTQVKDLDPTGGRLRWQQLDASLPLPLSFDDGDVALAQKAGAHLDGLDAEPLVVHGLPAGRYELRIDGESIASFTDRQLADGVDLARHGTPQRRQAFAVRWSVEDSRELQLVRRRLLASPGASARTAAGALTELDAASRGTRRAAARPKSRSYELVPAR
jgi:lysophospholipase L1-like esterase